MQKKYIISYNWIKTFYKYFNIHGFWEFMNLKRYYKIYKFRVSSVWPPGLNAFESIVIYDRNAQLFQSFLGQLKKNITPNCFFWGNRIPHQTNIVKKIKFTLI